MIIKAVHPRDAYAHAQQLVTGRNHSITVSSDPGVLNGRVAHRRSPRDMLTMKPHHTIRRSGLARGPILACVLLVQHSLMECSIYLPWMPQSGGSLATSRVVMALH
jgi:hypothetical protein